MAVVANLDAILGANVQAFERGISGAIVSTEKLQMQLREAGLTQRDWNRLQRESARVTASVRTPLEIYQQELRDLDRLLRTTLITQETFNRATRQAAVNFRATQVASRGSLASLGAQASGYVRLTAAFAAFAVAREAFRRSNQFEQNLTASTAIIGGLNDDLRDRLTAGALEVSRLTTASAEEAAEAYFFLFSAGLDVEQSISALPQVARFAQAGLFDLATATDLATDAQSALGLTVDDAQQNLENLTLVTDTLVGANTLANASVEQFSQALTNRAAAASRALNVDISESVAVLAAFADQGVKGEEAGTRLAIVLRDLTTQAINNEAAFESAGVQVFDSVGNFSNVGEIIADLEVALADLSDEAQKSQLIELGFTDRSIAGIQALLGTSDQIAEYEQQLRDAAGTTEEVADNQFTSLSTAINELNFQFDRLTTSSGGALDGIATIVDNLAFAIEALINTGNAIQSLFQSLEDVPGFEALNEFIRISSSLRETWEFVTGSVEEFLGVGSTVDDQFAQPAQAAIDRLEELGLTLEGVTSESPTVQAPIDLDALNAAADGASGAVSETSASLSKYQSALDALRTPSEIFNGQVSDLNQLLSGGSITQDQFNGLIGSFEEQRDSAIANLNRDPEAEAIASALQSRADSLIDSLRSPLEELQDRTSDIQELFSAGLINNSQFEQAIARENAAIEDLVRNANQAADRVDIRDSIEQGSSEAFDIIFGRESGTRQEELSERSNELNSVQIELMRELLEQMQNVAESTEETANSSSANTGNNLQIEQVNW